MSGDRDEDSHTELQSGRGITWGGGDDQGTDDQSRSQSQSQSGGGDETASADERADSASAESTPDRSVTPHQAGPRDGSQTTGDQQRVTLKFWRHLTYGELHAAELGLTGALASLGVALGYEAVVGYATLGLFSLVFGTEFPALKDALPPKIREYVEPKAVENALSLRVIQAEPWYFVSMFVLSALIASVALGFAGYDQLVIVQPAGG